MWRNSFFGARVWSVRPLGFLVCASLWLTTSTAFSQFGPGACGMHGSSVSFPVPGGSFFAGTVPYGNSSAYVYGYNPYLFGTRGTPYGTGAIYGGQLYDPTPVFQQYPTPYSILRQQQRGQLAMRRAVSVAAQPIARNQPVQLVGRQIEKPSTDEAKLKSLRLQQRGDEQLKNGQLIAACGNYRLAVNAAKDRPEPYFHWGVALLARHLFHDAVEQFRSGIDVDPKWPQQGPRFTEILGDDQNLTILQLKDKAGEWVQADIRDPDRVFILGLVLLLDGDEDRSREVFGTASRLAGNPQWIQSFVGGNVANPLPVGNVIAPQQPEPKLAGPVVLGPLDPPAPPLEVPEVMEPVRPRAPGNPPVIKGSAKPDGPKLPLPPLPEN